MKRVGLEAAPERQEEAEATAEPAPSGVDAESPQEKRPRPPSPFRRVMDGGSGALHRHQSDLIYAGEQVLLNLSTGETLANCPYMRGHLMSGKNLYFAARLSSYSACPDQPFLLERVQKKWHLRRFIDAHDLMLDEWVAGTTIAAVVPYRLGPPWGYELVKVAGGVNPPRPRPGPAHPTDPDQKCYTELQQPVALFASRGGALRVVGAHRCEFSGSGEELSPEEEQERGRPAIESFPSGSFQSRIFSLPIDEIISSIEGNSENLFILGKIKEGWQEDAPFELSLLSFDGKSVRRLPANLEGARQLVWGPGAEELRVSEESAAPSVRAKEGASEGASEEIPELLRDLWISDGRALRSASGKGAPLWFPESCSGAFVQFWRGHPWLSCDDGIYTTDPKQELIQIPVQEGSATCEELDPRPEYAVRGVYQKPSTVGGCGKEHSFESFEGATKSKTSPGKPLPRDPGSERRGGSGIPHPKGVPSKLRFDF